MRSVRAELAGAARPADLVPGRADDVEILAAELRRFAQGAAEAAAGVRALTLGGWQGQAAAAFGAEVGEAPKRLEAAARAFETAERALRSYASALWAAQDTTAEAIRVWQDGEARSRAAGVALGPGGESAGGPDPGEAARSRAEAMVYDARTEVAGAEKALVAALEAAAEEAPDKPGLLSRLMHAVASFGGGAVEATAGLGEFVYKLTPTYLVTNPRGYLDNLEMLGAGLKYGVAHPGEFGKALLDWETWKHDPARALGHLVPDLLLALATGGAGSAVRGTRVLQGSSRAAETVDAARRMAAMFKDGGSIAWRGKGLAGEGLTLTARDNAVAEAFHGAAVKAEESLSPRVRALMDRHGAEPYGWEYRVKGEDSLKRKLSTRLGADPEGMLDPVDEMVAIQDNLRYTAAFPDDRLAAGARDMAEALKADGFQELKFRNTFGSDAYQGINSTWRDPATGQSFELQFHTPDSFEAKMATHPMYEEMRLPDTSPERWAELERLQNDIFGAVPRPPGAPELVSPPGPPRFDAPAGAAGFAGAQLAGGTDQLADQVAEEAP